MVFPLSDDNSDRQRVPWVTWSLIAANVVVFVLFQQGGKNDDVTLAFCQVPAEIVTGKDIVTEPTMQEVEYEGQHYQVSVPGLRPTPIPVYLTLLTGIFLHGGWMHLRCSISKDGCRENTAGRLACSRIEYVADFLSLFYKKLSARSACT